MSEPQLLLCACPDQNSANSIARQLVDEQLAACVNIISGINSVYRWQGEVHDDPELLLLIKSTRSRYDEIEQRVLQLHPYDTPELIALPITSGLPAYLTWLRESTEGTANNENE
ncbi:divalent-cation tolerance protein CutA [Idiomarina xiamenensis]|uniref:Divalent cation tolerance protein n=1 Tax=Idiomarina xiamenensis 10-D-4 TaxID=740709 RepID=K2K9T6_9GAMM|nr:divalent-cation tolerance protein CutA [Idiomarina xiamenensis]EKE84553.1 divalent cation tolerance protein [Idiomarina xiamenensis 10-D-4]